MHCKFVFPKCILVGFLLLLVGITHLNAQSDTLPLRRHSVHAELFGHGILYSLNYNFRFHQHAAFHAGFSYWGFNSDLLGELHLTAFPISLVYLSGKKENHLEIGAGVMPVKLTYINSGIFSLFSGIEPTKARSDFLFGIGTIGYRFQSMEDGFMLRLSLTPILSKKIVLYAGASAGISF